MIVVLFRSRLTHETNEAGADYEQMAEEMLATAKTMPGFIDFRSYKSETGERISVVWWEDLETMAAWRAQPRHRLAQRLGREKWYQSFQLEVAEVIRGTSFERQ